MLPAPRLRCQLRRAQPCSAGAGNWLGRVAVGLSFTLGSKQPAAPAATATTLATTSGPFNAWLQYQVKDANGQPVGQPQQVFLPSDNPTTWHKLQLGVRVQQGGTVELTASSAEATSYVMFDNLTVEQTGGLIVQEQHQYAFGAPLPGLSYTVGNRRYRYGYQGQYAEHDDETGFESFELRLYNSRVGRWLSYDPQGQYNSPYVGMGNNPVSGIDPTGGQTGGGIGGFFNRLFNGGNPVALETVSVTASAKDVAAAWDAYNGIVSGGRQHILGLARSSGTFIAGLLPFTSGHSWKQLGNQANSLYNFTKTLYAVDRDVLFNHGRGTVTRGAIQNIYRETIRSGVRADNFIHHASSEEWGGAIAGGILLVGTDGLGEVAESAEFYSVAYEVELPVELYGKGYTSHFRYSNVALNEAMQSDVAFSKAILNDLQIEIPRKVLKNGNLGAIEGKSPANWVWHHDSKSGIMQLVPKSQHSTSKSIYWLIMHPGGRGGMSLWGR